MEEFGVREVVCGIVYFALNIPMGWIADRLSRKTCNVIGDLAFGVGLVIFATANSFAGTLIAGIAMAFGNAAAWGADEALFLAHCEELGKNYIATRKRLDTTRRCFNLAYSLAGGLLATYDLRLTLLVASVPFFLGAILAYSIQEIGTRKEIVTETTTLGGKMRGELQGLWTTMRYALREDRQLFWLLIAHAVGNMLGGSLPILIGPLLLKIEAPTSSLGVAYALLSVSGLFGSWLSRYAPPKWSNSTLFVLPCIVSVTAMATLSISLSLGTLLLGLLIPAARAWITAIFPTLIHKVAVKDVQATIGSLSSSVTMPFFVVATLVIGYASGSLPQLGVAANAALFLPFILVTWWKLRRFKSLKA